MTARPRRLWCVNVLGPDDVMACRNRADANREVARLAEEVGTYAAVIEWPHSRESHAEDLVRHGGRYEP